MFDRVLVQRRPIPTRTPGGLYLPEKLQKSPREAQVIAVSKGLRNVEGKFNPLGVFVGDTVLLQEHRGDPIKWNGEDYLLVREEHILAKVVLLEHKSKGAKDIPDMRTLPKA
uniref:20 kDa chaperonin, chloroplastic n=1 Tax=Arcella intermedia TaxID=1963864 RepID=A0A6B2LST8_9EUKA